MKEQADMVSTGTSSNNGEKEITQNRSSFVTTMKQLKPFVKSIFDLLFVSFLVGSALALFFGIAAELIYPRIANEYWKIWWVGWILGVTIWAVITKKKESIKRESESDKPKPLPRPLKKRVELSAVFA